MTKTKSEKLEKINFRKKIETLPKIQFQEILEDVRPIIFDTNFLFVTFEFKIDIIAEIQKLVGTQYTLYIYQGTIDELENIERKKDKNKKFIPLIATMLQRYNFKIIESNQKYIDDQIMENLDLKVLIATNDKELRHRIWDERKKVIYMRQTNYLEIK